MSVFVDTSQMEMDTERNMEQNPLTHHYPFMVQEAYTIIKGLCICEHNSEGEGYGVDPLSTTSTQSSANKPIQL